jgi:hypothetical protein
MVIMMLGAGINQCGQQQRRYGNDILGFQASTGLLD